MEREGSELTDTGLPGKTFITDTRIRHWLLDAAIQQYSETLFIPKKRIYLPAEVFQAPGMSETEMLDYLASRGASRSCIKFAITKYREANGLDMEASQSTGTCSEQTQSGESIESPELRNTNPSDPVGASRLRSMMRRLRRLFG